MQNQMQTQMKNPAFEQIERAVDFIVSKAKDDDFKTVYDAIANPTNHPRLVEASEKMQAYGISRARAMLFACVIDRK